MLDLSVVVPAFNEELRIAKTLMNTCQFLAGRRFEVIVVSDGSTDGTTDVVKSSPLYGSNIRLIHYESNRGKGFATRLGVLAAGGKTVLCQDADGSTPICELVKLEHQLNLGVDIAIGSRNMPGTRTRVQAKLYRKLIGNAYNMLVQTLLLRGLHDTQCGFKLFTREGAHNIFKLSVVDGFSYDVEILTIARNLGLRTIEVAVDWHHVDGSKINLALTPLSMFIDVFRIRKRTEMLYRKQLRSCDEALV